MENQRRKVKELLCKNPLLKKSMIRLIEGSDEPLADFVSLLSK